MADAPVATYSICAWDGDAGQWGVATQSKFLAVGSVVPWAVPHVGAIATQAYANPRYGPEGLALLGEGLSAGEVVERLTSADDDRAIRQLGVVDGHGRAATFTGDACHAWAGGRTGDGYAAQGNILVGEEVVGAMSRTFAEAEGDLCDRLLAALLAGDAAGGDRRGRQSAALLVVREGGGYEGRNDRYIDLRVDDHPDAPAELARLFDVWDTTMLIRNDPFLAATPELIADLQRRLAALGKQPGDASGVFDDRTRAALAEWAGEHNLEGRLRGDDQISNLLIAEIRDVTPELPPP